MLITDFRKGNAPGVGACLTLASASTYRKIKHARYITYPREKGVYIYMGKSEKKKARIGPDYTRIVSLQPPCSQQEAVESSRCCTPTQTRLPGKKLKAHDIMTTLTKEQNGYELTSLPPPLF